jgi:hypothetical protein
MSKLNRILAAAVQGIRREKEVDEAKLNISRFITIGRSTPLRFLPVHVGDFVRIVHNRALIKKKTKFSSYIRK